MLAAQTSVGQTVAAGGSRGDRFFTRGLVDHFPKVDPSPRPLRTSGRLSATLEPRDQAADGADDQGDRIAKGDGKRSVAGDDYAHHDQSKQHQERLSIGRAEPRP